MKSCLCRNEDGEKRRHSYFREMRVANTIGTLNEKPLHAALKQWYAEPEDRIEAPVDGFTVDIVRGDLLIEIQTRNLSGIKRKLQKLAEHHRVMLIYPIARETWILRQSKRKSRTIGRRKSPRRGSMDSVFDEFVSVASLLSHPNFSFQVVFIQEEQVRHFHKTGNWRRQGWRTSERRLLRVLSHRLFETPEDMLTFLPESLPSRFTTADLAEATSRPVWLAQKVVYCLRTMGAVEAVGKRNRWILYKRAEG